MLEPAGVASAWLLGLTLGSAYVPMGWFNVTVNLGVSVAKMLLVMTFFMHLRNASALVRIFSGIGFLWLLALLVLSLIDLEHQILPDVITLPGIVVGLAASFLPGSEPAPLASLAAAAGGWLAFAAVAKAYEKTRGVEGLGQGDWKLAALLGAFLGWQKLLLTVLLASVAGTVVGLLAIALRGRDMRYALPLGTFLGGAGVLVVFLGDALLGWYRGLFGG